MDFQIRKQQFLENISLINDENTILYLEKMYNEYIKKENEIDELLKVEMHKRIELAEMQIENGEFISNKVMKDKINKWKQT